MKKYYEEQVKLLLDVMPVVFMDERFLLKGGTAINLFYQNYPRLSVDIDISYAPLEDRKTTFKNIHGFLRDIKTKLEKDFGLKVSSSGPLDGKDEVKITVVRSGAEIKIEPNYVVRGTLFPHEKKVISKKPDFS